MSLSVNARRKRLRVSLSLDLSSEIDRMDPRQVKRERFSLGFRGNVLSWYPIGLAMEPGKRYMESVR